MKLIDNWEKVLKHAWSLRLIIVSGLFSGVEAFLPMWSDTVPRGIFALISLAIAIAAAVSRFVSQPKMYEPKQRKWRGK